MPVKAKKYPMTYDTLCVLREYLQSKMEKVQEQYLVVVDQLAGSQFKRARAEALRLRGERMADIQDMIRQLEYAARMSNADGNAACRAFWGFEKS